jgi:hypothetical protein
VSFSNSDAIIASSADFGRGVFCRTQKRREEYEQSGWHVATVKGNEIEVSEKAKFIICSVLEHKSVIDAGLKYHATR